MEDLSGSPTPAPKPDAMREQRKIVTVLAADVVGSTALGERLDPEDVRLVVGGAIQRMIAAVEDLGGTVKDLAGDGLFALFGAPLTHEDDPERAVRTALRILREILEYAGEVERGWGIPGFSVRIGIASGPAVLGPVGGGSRIEYGATGDVANTAARLQSAADPGTVLVEASTARLIEPLFEWGEARSLTLKGKAEPVTAYPAMAPVHVPGKVRGLQGAEAELVGRDGELTAAWTAVEDVLTGTGGVLFVTGEAGIGKSRLLSELRSRFEASESPGGPPTWLEGQCASYGEATPYGPFADLLRSWLHVASDSPDLRTWVALRREVERLSPERAGDVYPFLGTMLGLSLEADAAGHVAQLSPEALQRKIFDAAGEILAGLAQSGPVVMSVDDVQWADPTSVQLALHLLSLTDRAAVLVVLAGRLDRDHDSYRLRETALRELPHRVREVSLEALADRRDEELLSALVGPATLPVATRARVLDAAGGNPFFLEELVRSMQDSGALERWEQGWRFDHDAEVPVPESIQNVILARMDRLPSASHDLLTAASVLGRQFPATLLEAVGGSGPETEAALRELQRLDLLREARRWPEEEYRFKHQLIQETAYRSLLGDRRRDLHRRAAEAMERLAADGVEERLAVLAHHYREAGETARAIDYLRRAGDAARRVFAVEEALDHYGGALELAEGQDVDVEPDLAADLHFRRGRVGFEAGRMSGARRDYEAALEGARRSGNRALEVRSLEELGSLLFTWGGGTSEGVPLLEEGLRAARELGDLPAQVSIRSRLCIGLANELNFRDALEHGELGLALARGAGDDAVLARAMDGVKMVAAHLGDFETLDALLPELEEILRRSSDLWYLQWAVFESSFEPMARARWDEAESRVQDALAINRRVGDRADEPYFLAGLGSIHRARGSYGMALQLGRQAMESASELDRGWWVAWCEAHLGATLLDLFAVDEAIGHLHRGLRAAERTGTRHYLLRCLGYLAWAYWLSGDRPAALGAAERAEEILAGVTTPPGLAFLHCAPAYLAVAHVRFAAQEPLRAEALVGHLIEAAERAAWAEVVAQGFLLVGRCRGSAGDAIRAEEALFHAQVIAAEAGLPGLEWRAEAALADLLIVEDRVGEARQHLLQARAIVDGLASTIPDETTRERFRQGAFSAVLP